MTDGSLITGNLFQLLPVPPPGSELAEILLSAGSVLVERIVSAAHATPSDVWYDQAWTEWVAVLQGSGVLQFEDGKEQPLAPGDWIVLPPRVRHRVASTSGDPPCIWLAIHLHQTEAKS